MLKTSLNNYKVVKSNLYKYGFYNKLYKHKCINVKEHNIKLENCFIQSCKNQKNWTLDVDLYFLKHFNEIESKKIIDEDTSDDLTTDCSNISKSTIEPDNILINISTINNFKLLVNKVIFIKRIINHFLNINRSIVNKNNSATKISDEKIKNQNL